MKTATIIDLIVDSDVHTQSINHIIKQQHISQRMRRRLRNDGIITVNGKFATWNTLIHGGDHLIMKLTPEQAELFLRSRRSIRNYQNKPVPAELIRKVLNVARMAPTATNTQGISYIVIRDKQKLRRIADLVLEWMHLAAKTVPIMRLYARAAQAEVDKGKEYILRDAPALVVAIGSKKDIHRTHDSGHSCLSYAELYAPTLGLGTCWAGFFEHAGEAEYKPLLELLGVPEDKIIAGGILMGYPKVRYRNIVERQPLDVTFDTEE